MHLGVKEPTDRVKLTMARAKIINCAREFAAYNQAVSFEERVKAQHNLLEALTKYDKLMDTVEQNAK